MKFFLVMLVFAVVGFVLHLLWERSHIGLYTAYEKMEGVLPVYLFATIGDIVYMLGAILLVGIIKGDTLWLLSARPTDFLVLIFFGFAIALFVEYKALALERWAYGPSMPMISWLHVGLTPILQMSILLPLSAWCTKLIGKSFIS